MPTVTRADVCDICEQGRAEVIRDLTTFGDWVQEGMRRETWLCIGCDAFQTASPAQ
jgi:hypothetical protein